MTSSSKKWKKLTEGDDFSFWRTPEKKNGEYYYVYRRVDIDMYFTPEEFSEFIDGVFQVNDDLCQPQSCYQ
jgi:predicted DNA-binding ArsR family transcriptional regulator